MAKSPTRGEVKAAHAKAGSHLSLHAFRNVYMNASECRFIVFKEKHGDRHFMARTGEETLGAFLQVLTDRYGPSGWWGSPDEHIAGAKKVYDWDPTDPGYSREAIADMPESLQEEATAKLNKYENWLKETEEEVRTWELVKRAIETKDAEIAYGFMEKRQDFEEAEVPDPVAPLEREPINA
jgi:hypothetical protein